MPPGRKPDLDKKINFLAAALTEAVVEREKVRIAAQVDALVTEIRESVWSAASSTRNVDRVKRPSKASPAAAASRKGNRKPRSAASRAKQAARMKAFWRAKKAGEGKAKRASGKTKAAQGAEAAT